MHTFAALGLPEWIIIVAVVVLLFGARKLPQLARSMGASITEFKRGLKDEEPKLGDGEKEEEKES
jgi:sec-independent protein translocase protein TatA